MVEKMEQNVIEIGKKVFDRMRAKAVASQNNNSPDTILSYYVIRGKQGNVGLLQYQLSLWKGSKPSYILYKNVNDDEIERISGIPIDKFVS